MCQSETALSCYRSRLVRGRTPSGWTLPCVPIKSYVRLPPFSNIHVGNLKSPRGYFLFSTWASFISSEVSFDSSEEFFLPHVGNKNSPPGYFEISTWESVSSDIVPYQYVVGSKLMRQPWISGGVFGLLRYSSYLCRYKRPRSGAVVARWAHNPKVTGSSPVSATMIREVSFPTGERHLFFLFSGG